MGRVDDSRVVAIAGQHRSCVRAQSGDQDRPLQVNWVGVGGLLAFFLDHLVSLSLTNASERAFPLGVANR